MLCVNDDEEEDVYEKQKEGGRGVRWWQTFLQPQIHTKQSHQSHTQIMHKQFTKDNYLQVETNKTTKIHEKKMNSNFWNKIKNKSKKKKKEVKDKKKESRIRVTMKILPQIDD